MFKSNVGCPHLTPIYTEVIICAWRLVVAPHTYATYGAVNAVLIMPDTSKEAACNLMAASYTVANKRSVLNAAEGAAGGGTIMPFRVTKA